jgi:hypothetical protein
MNYCFYEFRNTTAFIRVKGGLLAMLARKVGCGVALVPADVGRL